MKMYCAAGISLIKNDRLSLEGVGVSKYSMSGSVTDKCGACVCALMQFYSNSFRSVCVHTCMYMQRS